MLQDFSHLSREELLQKLQAQGKTIEVLMDTVEQYSSQGASSLQLLSENVNLEKVVQQKTETLQRQGRELKKTLDELKQSQAQLLQAKKLESVGQLAAGIAHEINTPSQFIGTNIDFLEEAFADTLQLITSLLEKVANLTTQELAATLPTEVERLTDEADWEFLAEEIPQAIRQSQEGIKRISLIVQAMKEFSHPSAKEMVKNNVNGILETTIIVASNEWKYHADIVKNLAPNLPQVDCLADELGQVFLNLLVNAVHSLAEKLGDGGEKGTITVTTWQEQDDVLVSIKDTGMGIDAGIAQKIFDPFFTTKSVGKGTGQGLAIAHNVISDKHGGEIWCTSTPGDGAEFILRLPIQQKKVH